MKKILWLLGGLLLGGNGIIWAVSTDTINSTPFVPQVPVEKKIVELRITLKEITKKEDAKAHRFRTVDGRAVCSGSFVDNMGDIITAGHCMEGADEIEVITYDSKKYSAIIVATSSVHDLALIHIDLIGTEAFALAPHISRGETVFVLGSPLAITNTLSTGIIAKLNGDNILLDCSVLPGNSGSPVFDKDENLIGVATAVYIVELGVTHLSIVQGRDAVWFFVLNALKGRK